MRSTTPHNHRHHGAWIDGGRWGRTGCITTGPDEAEDEEAAALQQCPKSRRAGGLICDAAGRLFRSIEGADCIVRRVVHTYDRVVACGSGRTAAAADGVRLTDERARRGAMIDGTRIHATTGIMTLILSIQYTDTPLPQEATGASIEARGLVVLPSVAA